MTSSGDLVNGHNPRREKTASALLSAWRNVPPRWRRRMVGFFSIFLFFNFGYFLVFGGLPDAEEIKAYQPESTVKSGEINWDKRATQPIRLWVPLKRISQLLQKAVIISEDDTFYRHDGVNFEMMKEAFRVNLEKGRYVRGASTLTMQFARNAFLHKRKTLLRKIREIILARRIEENLSKSRILELYLNIVEWGEGIYGAETAARLYFGKSAANLNLSEATLLAAMLPNPKYFNPFTRLKSCRRMQARVLWLMQNAREITPEQAEWARTSDLFLRESLPPQETEIAAVDSMEEAKYLESVPMKSEIFSHPSSVTNGNNLPTPDTLATLDSLASDVPE
jgi:monofunctional biosynthetic peptidoglycan transglycosylase